MLLSEIFFWGGRERNPSFVCSILLIMYLINNNNNNNDVYDNDSKCMMTNNKNKTKQNKCPNINMFFFHMPVLSLSFIRWHILCNRKLSNNKFFFSVRSNLLHSFILLTIYVWLLLLFKLTIYFILGAIDICNTFTTNW